MSASETQIGGTHYTDMPIQPWDFMQSCMSREQFAGYLLGNVIKYAARHQAKGGIEDLRKARHYLDKLIETKEVMRSEPATPGPIGIESPAADSLAAGEWPGPWPGPDWLRAPEWARWWAAESRAGDAVGFWFSARPQRQAGGGWCFDIGAVFAQSEKCPTFGYVGHEYDSLRKRP